ncbi:hypothetical protein [Skermanella aerolata]|uniref:hypothetical protein n=1 Tax=Skermanella aerolata TaxID=393310 RepID=UPI0011BD4ECB|nr:hypothetical protein [Skermanella aerolata]
MPHHDPKLDVSVQEITFDQTTFRILLLQSADATAANSVLAYKIFILMAKLDPRLLPQKVKDQLGRSFSNSDFASSQLTTNLLTANLLTAAYGEMGRCGRGIRLFARLIGCL